MNNIYSYNNRKMNIFNFSNNKNKNISIYYKILVSNKTSNKFNNNKI
jgi:hypothetical protein